jgi:hypothetical protein
MRLCENGQGTMRVDSSIFLAGPQYIPVCWKLQSKRVLLIVTGLACSRLKTASTGFHRDRQGKRSYEDYSRCSLVVRPEY